MLSRVLSWPPCNDELEVNTPAGLLIRAPVSHSGLVAFSDEGEWRDRSRKHRYLMIFDKELKKRLTWKEEKW